MTPLPLNQPTDAPLPLSAVCPSWRGSLIPSSFEALNRGLQRLRDRTRNLPFLVLRYRREVDYDGLVEYIDLPQAFATMAEGVARVERLMADTIEATPDWNMVKVEAPFRLPMDSSVRSIRIVYSRGCRFQDGSGFNSLTTECHVLEATASEVIGPELLGGVASQTEWVAFLRAEGGTA